METEHLLREFQRRRAAFRRHWNVNVLVILGGLALSWAVVNEIVAPSGALPTVLAMVGMMSTAGGVGRAYYLVQKHRRCPGCGAVQWPERCRPYRACGKCGARLSEGQADSL